LILYENSDLVVGYGYQQDAGNILTYNSLITDSSNPGVAATWTIDATGVFGNEIDINGGAFQAGNANGSYGTLNFLTDPNGLGFQWIQGELDVEYSPAANFLSDIYTNGAVEIGGGGIPPVFNFLGGIVPPPGKYDVIGTISSAITVGQPVIVPPGWIGGYTQGEGWYIQ
jgi:hypothetical protein